MRKILIPFVAIIIAVMMGLSACDGKTPNPGGEDRDGRQGNFKSALDAYNYGKKHFEETAANYESTYHGTAKPKGASSIFAGEQSVYTHRYLSQNGDYFYDSANFSNGGLIDVSFSFLAAKSGMESAMHYKKIKGKTHIKKVDGVLQSDYSTLDMDSLTEISATDFVSTCGLNPREFLNYVINSDTIERVEYFVSGEEAGEFAYAFKFIMRSSAHEKYRNQVKYFSGYDYKAFVNLSLEFGMDEQGRIVQVTTSEEYSVDAAGGQKMKVEGTQYINYDKNPTISFDGFSIS